VSRDITHELSVWLESGVRQMGQLNITLGEEGIELRHFEDAGLPDLTLHARPEEARHLANLDDAGEFRPLKTAPNLRHGWRMLLADLDELRVALDYFYPAMLGALASSQQGQLTPVPLRETLGRQSGMYAVTKKITDEQADDLIGHFCSSATGCLKTILWRIAPDVPITLQPQVKFDPVVNQLGTGEAALPLLCHEACNLLVAQAREVVKKAAAQ
jgi:sirohydrochlorin cobaltochelatase